MKDEEKTKEELISELKVLRKKYTELKKFFPKDQKLKKTGGTETILVVDDNKDIRTATVEMLKRYGYNLLEAGSSQKAIEIFKSHEGTIHLVLSDVVMPGTNGSEMVKKLLDLQSEIKVVFMSGYAEDDIIQDDVFKIIHSDNPFIEKPFTSDEIGLIIRQQLDKKVGQK
jgi:two-component system, cell cycle sensor histidine kinase and response regulator CckA